MLPINDLQTHEMPDGDGRHVILALNELGQPIDILGAKGILRDEPLTEALQANLAILNYRLAIGALGKPRNEDPVIREERNKKIIDSFLHKFGPK